MSSVNRRRSRTGLLSGINQKYQAEKARKAELAKVRGPKLGFAILSYVGGFDQTHKNDTSPFPRLGTVLCFENELHYSRGGNSFSIPSDQIVSFEIQGKQDSKSRLTITRMVTLGVFSLAAPKRTTIKEASVIVGLRDGHQVLFHTKNYTESDVHRSLANAVSYYKSLNMAAQSPIAQGAAIDSAKEIMKFDILRKRGAITEEEFQAKKKKLLGL